MYLTFPASSYQMQPRKAESDSVKSVRNESRCVEKEEIRRQDQEENRLRTARQRPGLTPAMENLPFLVPRRTRTMRRMETNRRCSHSRCDALE
eukprot:767160-Hanusia_phi.AAC.5